MDKRKQHGFTLIEVLVCLTLLAEIAALTYPLLIYTLDAKERVEKHALLNKVGQAILKMVSTDLEGLYTRNVDVPFEGVDDGTQDCMNFTSAADSLPNEEGVRSNLIEVGYKLISSETHSDLFVLLRRESYHIEHDPLKGGQFYEVYDQVKQFNLTYYDGKEWVDTWDYAEMRAIPIAVKVEFIIRARTGEYSEEVAQEEERNEDKPEEEQEGYFSAVVSIPVATPPPPEEAAQQ